jgi:D-xylulose reductase
LLIFIKPTTTPRQVGDRVCMEPGVPVNGSKEVLSGVYNLCPGLRFWATPPRVEATNLTSGPSYLRQPHSFVLYPKAHAARSFPASDAAWKAGHGCLRPSVVHPAAFTFKLPDNVSLEWGAMVEPLSVGMHAATKARITPGDTVRGRHGTRPRST